LLNLLIAPFLLSPAPVRIDVVRDTWVSHVGREADCNLGGSPRLKAKGIQELMLLDISPEAIKGRTVLSAQLHVKLASPDAPLRRVTVSTISSDWVEGTARTYEVQPGSASFNWAEQDRRAWAYRGSDLTSVISGAGGSRWRFADATPPDPQGWQTIEVDPAVVAARGAGLSYGFAVIDDVGSEYKREGDRFTYTPFLNRFVFSRDQNQASAPYFTVELGPEDREPPGPPKDMRIEGEGDTASISWTTPRDPGRAGTLGFQIDIEDGGSVTRVPTYMVPLAGPPESRVAIPLDRFGIAGGRASRMVVRTVDAAGNVSEGSRTQIRVSPSPTLELPPAPTTFVQGPKLQPGPTITIVDALDKVHPVTGALIPAHPAEYLQENHLWSASKGSVRLFSARNEFVEFQIVVSGPVAGVSAEVKFDDPRIKATLGKMGYVGSSAGPLPDPVLPLKEAFAIPDPKIQGQKFASLLAEVFVPSSVTPGDHNGVLTVRTGGKASSIRVQLHVWDFALPNQLSFLPEMNCYGLPAPPQELGYYRLAQAHRTCLNRLPYSWRGTVDDGCAPTWNGSGFGWEGYDRRFGPLLDGSAFKDLRRGAVPVEVFYLPLNENWPIPIEPRFKGGYWADEALEPSYFRDFSAASGQFAAHLKDRGWKSTLFEFYLNNKVYFKEQSWSRSSAPWIFDEPTNTQDFWALRMYGKAFHTGADPAAGDAKVVFRCDISRPQWQRDLLDGVLDVNVVGGAFRPYRRLVLERKAANGEVVINYGSSNRIEDSNSQPAAWCVDAWTMGADGVLPWQTVGRAESWTTADPLSLFYPGAQVGSSEPVPSIRLKAYRRGQQDVEYLTILQQMSGLSRSAFAERIRSELKLQGTFKQQSAEDAGTVSYEGLDPAALWSLRVRVGKKLDGMKVPVRDRWRELRTPKRNMASLPGVGPIARSR
jgi:hypothetical protein